MPSQIYILLFFRYDTRLHILSSQDYNMHWISCVVVDIQKAFTENLDLSRVPRVYITPQFSWYLKIPGFYGNRPHQLVISSRRFEGDGCVWNVGKIIQVAKVSYPTTLKSSSAFLMGCEHARFRCICNLFQSVLLVKGTEAYEIWRKLPLPLSFNIYVFNVTNPDEVQNGSNPVVQEVGPYVYE